ncbi:toll/interleukin-1 receptor domain-containing protein [Sulfitobacter sp. W074]|uniref:toll/interleukin-1 receptor domain-containing protein n=1 Tax=Sulfitobacter sp. W074 TaxID=2867026 RepID=UPI0021A7F67F|nr:toll/interleukin-1 receptor domain-containing protein [Sulfitobacter sp. W074]UWR38632.1 toll/interleukin-1 receptor domain-containing protein [Sulfitobacter sp. W074]
MRAFISYSHRDKGALERLHVHLKNLIRDGHIETWYDRDILAGSGLDAEIERELEAADLFLLIVSPDFIASDYCVEREMKRALERHAAGNARVVPIIVEECDWKAMGDLRQLKAVPTDGKAISEWANPNTAYLNVVQELRRIIEIERAPASVAKVAPEPEAVPPATARYRARKDFDEIDRSDFREAAFDTIKDYFRRATGEIDSIDGLRGRFTDRGTTSFAATVVNGGQRDGAAHITVHCRNARIALGDIYYSFDENGGENTANGGFNLSADDYELFLVRTMNIFGNADEKLAPEQAAEMLWNEFIGNAGISYD